MTQHITQEQATQIAAQFAEDATYEFNIANAAIQHYLDQRNAELPLLPDTYGSVEEQIVERYRVGKTQGGFWPSCVKAGDGNMDVFVGSTKQAENVRQALQTACLDGAFIASQKAKEQYKDYGAACAAHARELALEEAKQAAENCDVFEVKGSTYYAQLSYAAATQRGIVAAIEALKGK